jgi:hypothetical protein
MENENFYTPHNDGGAKYLKYRNNNLNLPNIDSPANVTAAQRGRKNGENFEMVTRTLAPQLSESQIVQINKLHNDLLNHTLAIHLMEDDK